MFVSGTFLLALLLAPLGACVGSFLNVVIYRLPQGLNLSDPPSHCPHCGVHIKIYDNIPVFGWLLLRGRGRCCGEKISIRYPGVELLTALLWAAIGAAFAGEPYSLWVKAGIITVWLVFVSVLIAISFIDIDLQIIPDELSLGGTAGALIASICLPQFHPEFVKSFHSVSPHLASLLGAVFGAVIGAGVLLLITLAGTLAMRSKLKKMQEEDPEISTAIGFGDIKLMAFIGALMGWKAALVVLLLGNFGGAVFGLIEKIRTGQSAENSRGLDALRERWNSGVSLIPFGPFLCIAALVILFFKEPVYHWLADFFQPVIIIFS